MSWRLLAWPGIALIVGIVAWPGSDGHVTVSGMPLALLVPALWVWTGRAWQAALMGMAYHLAASRVLLLGASVGIDGWLDMGLWLGAGLLLGVTYGLLWCAHHRSRLWRLPWLLLVLAVPPLGMVGWAHPLTAAGLLFPTSGWWGLAATGALIVVLAQLPRHPVGWGVLGAVAALHVHVLQVAPLPAPTLWIPSAWTQTADATHPHMLPQVLGPPCHRMDAVRHPQTSITVRPAHAAMYGVPSPRGGSWVGRCDLEGHTGYPGHANGQRPSTPVSKGRTWTRGGFDAAGFARPVWQMHGQRAVALMGDEPLRMWPVLYAMRHRPERLIGMGNTAWRHNPARRAMQLAALKAWARLFDLPLTLMLDPGGPHEITEPTRFATRP